MAVMLALVAVCVYIWMRAKRIGEQKLEDAKAEAQRWYERLGGQTMNLAAGADNPAAQQALVDAGERYTAAGSQLERGATLRQYELAGDTAIEGLQYVRAARLALDLDAGPDVPATSGQQRAGAVKEDIDVTVEGKRYQASPNPGQDTTHYHPGGMVQGKPVPAGWYSTPWWRPVVTAGAWGVGSLMLFNAMIAPAMAAGVVAGAGGEGDASGGEEYAGDGGDEYAGGGFDDGMDFGGGFDGM